MLVVIIISRIVFLPDTAYFVNDQGRDMLVLREMFLTHKLPLIGPATSFGSKIGSLYFGPYYYYFLLPFFILSKSPLFITLIFPALFIVIELLVLKDRNWSTTQKIVFLLLSGFSWYVLLYTRFLWNLNLGFLLTFIAFLVALRYRKNIVTKNILLVLFGLVSGAVLQIHYATIFVFIGLTLIYFDTWKQRLLYIFSMILSLFPFLVFDIRHNFVLFHTFQEVAMSTSRSPGVNIVTSLFSVFAQMFDAFLIPGLPLHQVLKALVMCATLIFIAWRLYKKNTFTTKLLLLMMGVFLCSFILFKRDFSYYLACYVLFFYFSISEIIPKKLSPLIAVVLLIVALYNMGFYFQQDNRIFSLTTQEAVAKRIAIDAHSPMIGLNAIPHDDDQRGVAYILLQRYNISTQSEAPLRYFICFDSKKCIVEKKDILLLKENNVALYKKTVSK